MNGEMIEFKANGRTAAGYLCRPTTAQGPGVLVLQEYWGLVDHIKDVSDRVAAAGFYALAPDLYHGEKTTSPDAAGKLLMALDIAEAGQDLRGAADYLTAIDGVRPNQVAAVGFCMGGQLALYAACEYPDRIGAVVDFYGIHPNVHPDVSKLSGPVVLHFGKQDHGVPEQQAIALSDRIRAAGKHVDTYFYDAGHAFFNDARPRVYDAASAGLAWTRTLDFLHRALGASVAG